MELLWCSDVSVYVNYHLYRFLIYKQLIIVTTFQFLATREEFESCISSNIIFDWTSKVSRSTTKKAVGLTNLHIGVHFFMSKQHCHLGMKVRQFTDSFVFISFLLIWFTFRYCLSTICLIIYANSCRMKNWHFDWIVLNIMLLDFSLRPLLLVITNSKSVQLLSCVLSQVKIFLYLFIHVLDHIL